MVAVIASSCVEQIAIVDTHRLVPQKLQAGAGANLNLPHAGVRAAGGGPSSRPLVSTWQASLRVPRPLQCAAADDQGSLQPCSLAWPA